MNDQDDGSVENWEQKAYFPPVVARFSSDERYLDWIRNYRDRQRDLRMMCFFASEEMLETFLELLLCRGTVNWHPHWWCQTREGEVLDPTLPQFEDLGDIIVYRRIDESKADLLPTGKCPNCGEFCFNHRSVCSNACEREYAAYVMRSFWDG